MERFGFPIVLLAAGQSRRMRGRDKLMEDVGGAPLLQVQAHKARLATRAGVYVTLPPAPHARYGALASLQVTPVPVPDAAQGISASLRAGFSALPEGTNHAMVLLADLPDLTCDDLKIVAQAVVLNSSFEAWRGATEDGKPGHPIVFSANLFEALGALRGDDGAKEILSGRAVCKVALPGDHARADLDTPEDWAAWRARHRPPPRPDPGPRGPK